MDALMFASLKTHAVPAAIRPKLEIISKLPSSHTACAADPFRPRGMAWRLVLGGVLSRLFCRAWLRGACAQSSGPWRERRAGSAASLPHPALCRGCRRRGGCVAKPAPFLVGHSMGGFVVQKFLETHLSPAAFLLASIPPGGARPMYVRLMRNQPLDVLRANATLSLLPFISDPDRAQRLLFSAAMSPEDVARYHRLLDDESMLGALDCLALEQVVPTEVRSPIHVMGAADDAIVARCEIEATARAYGVEPEVFENVAHDMMLDPNWTIVADSMIKKLDAQFGRVSETRPTGADVAPA